MASKDHGADRLECKPAGEITPSVTGMGCVQNQLDESSPKLESEGLYSEVEENGFKESVIPSQLEGCALVHNVTNDVGRPHPMETASASGRAIAIGILAASSENDRRKLSAAREKVPLSPGGTDQQSPAVSSTHDTVAVCADNPLAALAKVSKQDCGRQQSLSSVSVASNNSRVNLDETSKSKVARLAVTGSQRSKGHDTATSVSHPRSSRTLKSVRSSDTEDINQSIKRRSCRPLFAAVRPSAGKKQVSKISSRPVVTNDERELCQPTVGTFARMSAIVDGALGAREGSWKTPLEERQALREYGTVEFTENSGTSNSSPPREGEIEQPTERLNVVASIDLPGAFAISGRRRSERRLSGYDSLYEDRTDEQESADSEEIGDVSQVPNTQDPVHAELYEENVTNASVVLAAREKYDGRAKMFKKTGVLASLAILVVVLSIVLTQREEKSSGADVGTIVPSIVGWDQVGRILLGPTDQDNARFGFAVALSGDGNRLAVGLPGLDDNDESAIQGQGGVVIMDFNGTDWVEVGRIYGEGQGTQAGSSVKLSYEGSRIAIGCPGWSAQDGYVGVYEEVGAGGSWVAVGDLIVGAEGEGEEFGGSLAFSDDGTMLVVGAKFANAAQGTLENAGAVRVFNFTNSSWSPLGGTVYGEDAGDLFGWDVAMSDDGLRIVASAIGAASFTGEVKVYDFVDGVWKAVGKGLQGDTVRENFGASVALSSNGNTLGVGATGFSADGTLVGVGCARVFQLEDATESWELTSTISGNNSFDRFGSSVDLSKDGKKCAIGGPENDSFGGSNGGHVRVFGSNAEGSEWISIGSDLGDPEATGGYFGTALAMSARGSRVAVGAPLSMFNGFRSGVGRVIVFESAETRNMLSTF
eukprot:scaffold13475_cov103-Cylindrotheca_fusiformis.AAC.4